MPSEDYNRFTDDDLAALVAYVRQLPPAAGGGPVLDLPLPVRVLYGFGLIHDAADKIDHTLRAGAAGARRRERCSTAPTWPTCAWAATARSSPAARSPAARPTGRPPPT